MMKKSRKEILKDIKEHPERHKHGFEALMACCVIDGAIDSSLMDAHSKYVNLGSNAGVHCDVAEGPCACGAWH